MRLTFLGTAASEGYPDAFCGCVNCVGARAAGGRNVRLRAAALIDDDLLIDFGPDILAASTLYGAPLTNVAYCLQTHDHEDHLNPHNFFARSPMCEVEGAPRMRYFASRNAIERAMTALGNESALIDGMPSAELCDRLNIDVTPIAPFQTFMAGPYRVTTVRARHAPETVAMLFVIERDGRTLFYATDTADFPDETWQALRTAGFRFDVVALDHTFGDWERSSNAHLTGHQFRAHLSRLRDEGMLAPGARVFAHHFVHHSNPLHDELVALGAQHGYEIAYDGLRVRV
jgi:phosphoribosyl 1,2-cyclic phosphate phosphodiesterase